METLFLEKASAHDTINSLLVLRVYYQYSWRDTSGNLCNSFTYYLKFTTDRGYAMLDTELPRAFERLTAILRGKNPFVTAIVYHNLNKARTIRNKENPIVFKIVNKKTELQLTLGEAITDNNTVLKEFVQNEFFNLMDVYTNG